ncbi:MAG: nuclease, partial [Acidobacteriota bacterium]
ETKQFGKEDKYKNPNTKEDNFLNDRPPLMLRLSIDDAKTGKPFEFTVFANHLKSYLGYSDPKQSDNVRLKKKLQAEFLARLIQTRQTADPKERIIVLGDFNSYQFSDGIMDQIGTITGKPAGKDAVLIPSDDLVNPDLINLVDVIAAGQRYSYIYDGNSQTLDHIIITETLRKHTTGFGFARINADFPQIYRNDGNRFERFSDHDPAVAIFTMDDMTAGQK